MPTDYWANRGPFVTRQCPRCGWETVGGFCADCTAEMEAFLAGGVGEPRRRPAGGEGPTPERARAALVADRQAAQRERWEAWADIDTLEEL